MGPGWAKIEKPDPTQGQTIGRTPWNELQGASPYMFDGDGKYSGPGKHDPSTHQYFDFAYKGQKDCKIDRTSYTVSAKLLEDLRSNAPHLKVLGCDNRWLIDLEMLKIFEALGNDSDLTKQGRRKMSNYLLL